MVMTDDDVEKHFRRDGGVVDVERALRHQMVEEACRRGDSLEPAFLHAELGDIGEVNGL